MNTLAPELSALMTILRSTGPGDLDAAIDDVGGNRRAGPVAVADRARLGQEIGQLAGVELGLALRAAREQLGAAAAERALQLGRERDRLGRQDLGVLGGDAAGDLDAGAVSRACSSGGSLREREVARGLGDRATTDAAAILPQS